MKSSVFHIPGRIRVEYQRHREGPKEVFILWTPNTARSFRSEQALCGCIADTFIANTFGRVERCIPPGRDEQEFLLFLDHVKGVDTADTDATVSTADTATGA